MSTTVAIIRLRNAFASIYEDDLSQRRVVQSAKLDSRFIQFGGSVINVWSNIFSEAKKRNKVDALVTVAVKEYPENEELRLCELLWIASQVQLTDQQLQELYVASIPSSAIKGSPANTIEDALDNLWRFPLQSNGTLLVLEFAERLAQHTIKPFIAQRLRRWVDEAPSKLNFAVDLHRIEQLRNVRADTDDATESTYLSVVILPHWDNRNRPGYELFLMQIIFWKNQDNDCWYDEETPLTLSEIPAFLQKIIHSKIGTVLTKADSLTVECFLPTELLSEAIDQWELQGRYYSQMKYGMRYRVVVRSLERVQVQELQLHWRTKWAKFRAFYLSSSDKYMLWVSQLREYKPVDLYAKLTREELCTCVGLAFSLFDPALGFEMFYKLLLAGIPVIVWLRPCQETILAERLQVLIPHDIMHRLPDHFYKLRNEAVADAKHPGNHLTLLWDDPTRIPPQFTDLLTQP